MISDILIRISLKNRARLVFRRRKERKKCMNYLEELNKLKKEQEELISRLKKHSKMFKKRSQKKIKVSKKKGSFQYYLNEEGKYRYIRASEKEMVKEALQREYEEALLTILEKNCAALRKLIRGCNRLFPVEGLYEKLPEGKKILTDPLVLTNELYIKKWYESNPGGRNPFNEEGRYITDRGEAVRSKSEKIIADLFYKRGIPYQYEPEIILKDGSKLYPDFILLNVSERKTYIWEHLGLISDDGYAAKNMRKIQRYDSNGIQLGINLILSAESDEYPLKLSEINAKIDKYLL